MNNKNKAQKAIILLLALSFLTACHKTEESYKQGEFQSGTFKDYFFTNHDEIGSKKGKEIKQFSLDSSSYWSGTAAKGESNTFTPLAYKFLDIFDDQSVDGSKKFAITNWSSFEAVGNEKDGYIWYFNDYRDRFAFEVKDAGKDLSNQYTLTISSSDSLLATASNLYLSLFKEGEVDISFVATHNTNGSSLSFKRKLSIIAPYGTRKGMSDDNEVRNDLFNVKLGKNEEQITLSPASDWHIGRINESDEDFFNTYPAFGRYYSLGRVDSRFKDGYLGKLYNGQMYCLGYHSLAFVCIENNGFTQLFPRTIKNAPYFFINYRGGSDSTDGRWGANYGYGEPRISAFDLSIDFFYKNGSKYDYVTVKGSKVISETDHGGEGTTLYGFSLKNLGIPSDGICGISVHYDNFEDLYSKESGNISSTLGSDKKVQFGLLLYEILFPNASWY